MLTSRDWKVSNSILKRSANKSHCIQSDLIAVSKEQITLRNLCLNQGFLENPARVEMQADGRIRYWGQVGKKWLRVVVENDALHNAFFDRSYKP